MSGTTSSRWMVIGIPAAALFIIGCPGPEMRPGEACLSCHSFQGSASDHPFTAAGTVFSSPMKGTPLMGATVTLRDRNGKQEQLQTNGVGNFYTRRPLAPPISAIISYGNVKPTRPSRPMSSGDCNTCHR